MNASTEDERTVLEQERDEVRAQLAVTVDELSRRLDIRTRIQEKVLRIKDMALETYRENPPAVVSAGVLVVLGVVCRHWRRRTQPS